MWLSVWLPHRVNDTVSVRIGYAENVLVADGTDPSRYVKPILAELIPIGNLHLAELVLYRKQLQENVKLRIRRFTWYEQALGFR